MSKKIYLITGATGGMGKVTARAIAQTDAQLVLISRNQQKLESTRSELIEESGNKNIDIITADLSELKEIRKAAEIFNSKYERLDVLINNAGVIVPDKRITSDGFEYTFALNHFGYFLLTALVLDKIPKDQPSRIVNISSAAHLFGHINFEDLFYERNKYSSFKAYSQSKLANALFTFELAERLSSTQITVNCVHPGGVRTNFGSEFTGLMGILMKFSFAFMRNDKKGAKTCIHLALSDEVENITGKYFADKKIAKSSKESLDKAIAKKLWEVSEKLTQVSFQV